MAVHHISPHEKKAKARKRAKHPHRTIIEHLKKGGHVVTHEYAAADGDPQPAYGPGFEDKQAFEDKPSLMTHLASAIPGSGGAAAAPSDGDEG